MKFFAVFILAVIAATDGTPRQSNGLCSGIYQFCTSQSEGVVSTAVEIPRVGKAGPRGPRGPPGKNSVVDYDVINATISKMFEALNSSVRSMMAPIQAALENYAQSIGRLQAELQTQRSKISSLRKISGWFAASNGNWYRLVNARVNYATAKTKCRERGANLASIGMRDETVRREILKTIKRVAFWMGLNDIGSEGHWIWEDGIASSGSDVEWDLNEPNNSGNEDCAYYHFSGSWKVNDWSCSRQFDWFLCEKVF